MKVTKQWLENEIKVLNTWLLQNEYEKQLILGYNQEVQKRNYYVNKLIELEENQLETIKV